MPPRRLFSRNALLSLALALSAAGLYATAPLAHADSLGPNLIPNPSFENGSSAPVGWLKGGYGVNTRSFTYPAAPAHSGSRAAQVSITSYVSGDAKWYFPAVSVAAGATYRFSDWYQSNVPSEVDVQVTHTNGTVSYIVLGKPSSSSSYAPFTAEFAMPKDAASATIFHVIARTGTMRVDDYALQRVTVSSPNLVKNGAFDTAGSGGLPYGWFQGGYGSNVRSFSYPVPGASGNGARVSVSAYANGDAKWYFAPVLVSSGVYTYSDAYQSNVPSMITVQFHHADGSYSYSDIAQLPASSSFSTDSTDFVVTSDVTDVTVFHLLRRNGTLTIDTVSLTRNTSGSNAFPQGAVTLTFDNGWLSQYQNAVPKLAANGLIGTFYIITHELADYGYSAYVSKTQIKQMYSEGMEIGSHTQTHDDLPSESYTQQQNEIAGSRQELLALNVGPIDSFAYPYGDYDATSTALVKAAGYTNARATINGYASYGSDRYHLPRLVILNSTTAADVKQWVDEAARDHVWLIIEFHQIDGSGDTYAMTPANFAQIVDYLKQKGIPVISITKGVQSLTQ